ncbi:MAG: hypothetical protein IT304_06730 [Dehalococcoidia bacterium]|nr:hypothetical protein [Dehalococcoidia bacterium]
MSPAQRKERRRRAPAASRAPSGPTERAEEQAARAVQPLPPWKWRTFPVFFALAVGVFLGVYGGVLAGYVNGRDGNGTPTLVLFVVAAILLGFAFSRLMTRWMIGRRWVKPRAKRR